MSPRRGIGLAAALLVALVVVVFAPVRHHDFVALDDFEFVVDNPQVQHGLSAGSVRWAFAPANAFVATGGPITWLSHMLDVQLFGMSPGPAHVVNLALHALNTVLLSLVLYQMTGAVARSSWVAALFAVHPLHVESVAWISARKDVLSLTLWLLTTAAYVRYTQRQRALPYLMALILFSLGLLAKPVLAMLPLTLLLLDVWPLRRARFVWSERARWRTLVVEKIPFVLLAGVAMWMTFVSQQRLGALPGGATLALSTRLANAALSYVSYLVKMCWPVNLAVFYPYPPRIPPLAIVGCAIAIAALSIVAWRGRSNRPYLTVGWLWYVGTLVPMIGLVQVGNHAMADRFTYVPLIGIFIAIVWVVAEIGASHRAGPRVVAALAFVTIASTAVAARAQVETWQNSETMWRHAMAVTKDNFRALAGRAEVEAARGDVEAAITDYWSALALAPDEAEWHVNVGLLLVRQDRVAEAAASFQRALQLRPNDSKTHNNLGAMLARQARWADAIAHYRRSIELSPGYALAHRNLGLALASTGDVAAGLRECLNALRLAPGEAQWHYEVAAMLLALNHTGEAIEQLQETIRLNPQHEAAREMLSRLGK